MIAAGSLRLRLLAGAAVWIVVALAVAGVVLAALFRAHVERRLEAELAVHLDQLAAALEAAPDGGPSLAREPSDPRFGRPYSGLSWQVNAAADEPALRSRSLWDTA